MQQRVTVCLGQSRVQQRVTVCLGQSRVQQRVTVCLGQTHVQQRVNYPLIDCILISYDRGDVAAIIR